MKKNIFVALDFSNFDKALDVANQVKNDAAGLKITNELFAICGKEGISKLANIGLEIFLDVKAHDVPNTVKKTIEGLSSLPIKILTVHTSGGKDMMSAAMEAISGTDIKVFGVTVLTSLNDDDTAAIFKRTPSEQVEAMLDEAESAGIDGVVCSPHELKQVKKRESLLSITPGIRLNSKKDDQKRVLTPYEAYKNGADWLVIGRDITKGNIKKNIQKLINHLEK